MCGILAFSWKSPIKNALLEGLSRLEYRGYDSAGIAVFQDQEMVRYRAIGLLDELRKKVPAMDAHVGMGHTRWATHGTPHESNTHPLQSHHFMIVHNGIVDNFTTLREQLIQKGYVFEGQTDTEVIAHLLDQTYRDFEGDLAQVFAHVLPQLEGNFSLALMVKGREKEVFAVRKGSTPLVIGQGENGYCISSDALGCAEYAHSLHYLDTHHWACISSNEALVYDAEGNQCTVDFVPNPFVQFQMDKGSYEHYMLKEIYEQPSIIRQLLAQSLPSLRKLSGGKPEHLTLLGCGTSFYAAWVGKYYLENVCPVTLELASEFHYRCPSMTPGLTLLLSQSGETLDTIKALEYAKSQGQIIASVVNVSHSSLARLSHWVLETQAGPEVAVASTKSFIAQLWLLIQLVGLDKERAAALPDLMEKVLTLAPKVQDIARSLAHAQSMLYLGRGPSYPLALEGALKMKELSYIHAEGMPSGELKHGPIALVDTERPIIMLAPYDRVFEKSLSNMHEIAARQGRLIIITDTEGVKHMDAIQREHTIVLPYTDYEYLQPFLYVIVLQLLAYYAALYRGCSIDKPRNLAKSVTVE